MEKQSTTIKTAISGIKDDVKELKISVEYDKGGYNPLQRKRENRGIYIVIRPLHQIMVGGRPFNTITCSGDKFQDGFKVFVKEMTRDNTNKTLEVFNKVNDTELVETIANLYTKKEFDKIADLLTSLIK